jgi:hypothetical protein
VRVARNLLAVACIALVSCGGTQSERVTVDAVARHTFATRRARIDGTLQQHSSKSLTHITGEADFSGKTGFEFQVDSRTAPMPFSGVIVIGTQGYIEGLSDVAGWCPLGPVTSDLTFDPTEVLRSIGAGGTLERVGNEMVRGVSTTRYRYLRADHAAMDLWVDADDRLRQVAENQDDETDTIDFYDFGANITPITAPKTSPKCRPLSVSKGPPVSSRATTP